VHIRIFICLSIYCIVDQYMDKDIVYNILINNINNLYNLPANILIWGGCNKNYRSLLQNIVSFIGLFCKRDL